MKKVSFVIPCYRSYDTVPAVVGDIADTVSARPELDYEIILVNDNAPDETWTQIKKLEKENTRVKGICFTRNFGQSAALMAGYNAVTGDIIVSLDDDGQTPPKEMFRLIDAIDDETDVVYASYEEKRHSLFRNFGSMINDLMICWLMHKPKNLYMSSYYAAKRFVINEMIRYKNSYPYLEGLVLRTTQRIKNVPVDHQSRMSGKSGYNLSKLLRLWLNGFTAFSEKPLRIATVVGGVISAFGLLMAVILFIRKILYGDAIDAGWTSLITVMFFLNGVMMIMLGLIGEYVGRIYISLNMNPQYIVLETTDQQKE